MSRTGPAADRPRGGAGQYRRHPRAALRPVQPEPPIGDRPLQRPDSGGAARVHRRLRPAARPSAAAELRLGQRLHGARCRSSAAQIEQLDPGWTEASVRRRRASSPATGSPAITRPQRPVGIPTRGTTGRQPAAPGGPLAAALAAGARGAASRPPIRWSSIWATARLPVTTLELAARLRTVRPDVRVVGLEIDPERVRSPGPSASGVEFARRRFRTRRAAPGSGAGVQRAAPVSRGRRRRRVATRCGRGWHRAG